MTLSLAQTISSDKDRDAFLKGAGIRTKPAVRTAHGRQAKKYAGCPFGRPASGTNAPVRDLPSRGRLLRLSCHEVRCLPVQIVFN
jgi:hypothetical protein